MERKTLKTQIRREIQEKRIKLTNHSKNKMEQSLFQNMISQSEFQAMQCIYCYTSMEREVDTSVFISYALAHKKRVAVPKVDGKTMGFFYIQNYEDLELGYWNILEPKSYCIEATEKNALVILPGVAFDRKGNRIGYGGGYYDRFLEAEPSHIKIAIAFDFQIYKDLPIEDFDVKMDYIITDKEVIGFE